MSRTRILLTGADSLTGSHTLDVLLSGNDVSVRAVVGSTEQAFTVKQQYRHSFGLYDVAVVPEIDAARPEAYDHVLCDEVEAFQMVFHTSTTTPTNDADCLARFISLESESLLNFLRSVQHFAKQVRRVVIVTTLTPFARWLTKDEQLEQHRRPSFNADSEYILAASQAGDNIVHDAVFAWVKSAHPHFDVVYVTTPCCYGPVTRTLQNSSDVSEANRRIWNICSNERGKPMKSVPYGIAPYSDVRDLAIACVRAAYTSHAGNMRFMVSAGVMPPDPQIAEILIAHFPELRDRISLIPPQQPSQSAADGSYHETLNTSATAALLGFSNYRTAEETITDTTEQILDLQRRKEWRRIIQI